MTLPPPLFIGWTGYVRSARLQANHNFDLKDDADREIDGNTTLDLSLSQETDFVCYTQAAAQSEILE